MGEVLVQSVDFFLLCGVHECPLPPEHSQQMAGCLDMDWYVSVGLCVFEFASPSTFILQAHPLSVPYAWSLPHSYNDTRELVDSTSQHVNLSPAKVCEQQSPPPPLVT